MNASATTTPGCGEKLHPGVGCEPFPPRDTAALPRLHPDLELLGEYDGSGFTEAPWLLRRGDGQVIQLPRLLYLVAAALAKPTDSTAVADEVSTAVGRQMTPDQVRYLVEEKLRPLGILENEDDGEQPSGERAHPLLALTLRAALVPPAVVQRITGLFAWLFAPAVVVVVLAGFVAVDAWLMTHRSLSASMHAALAEPLLILLVFLLVIVSAGFHELGHAAACRYGGARAGAMGAGLYIAWPVFYTDITDAYRLNRAGRLRVDLGGVYFNVIVVLVTAGAHLATGSDALLLVIFAQHVEIARQLLPIVRLDGYYVLSDITGVPDLFDRVKPLLASLVPGRPVHADVAELKPWVRLVVSGWVIVTIPALALLYAALVRHVPTMLSEGRELLGIHVGEAARALMDGRVAEGLVGVLRVATFVLPAIAVVFTLARTIRRIVTGGWRLVRRRGTDGRSVQPVTAARIAYSYAWWLTGDERRAEQLAREAVGEAGDQIEAILSAVRDRGPVGLRPAAELALLHDGEGLDLPTAARLTGIPPEHAPRELALGRLSALPDDVPPIDLPEHVSRLALGHEAAGSHGDNCAGCAGLAELLDRARAELADVARAPLQFAARR